MSTPLSKNRLNINQIVILNTPDNPYLHGHDAIVERVTKWGAHVLTKAAYTGRFRALFSEMVIVRQDESYDLHPVEALSDSNVSDEDNPLSVYRAKSIGYTGDICAMCNGCKMIRNGTCLLCQECGHTSGCS
jgi:hypothetical protein